MRSRLEGGPVGGGGSVVVNVGEYDDEHVVAK